MPLFRFFTRLTKKYSSLFTFCSESPVFIGIPRGEEYSDTLHLLFTTLHLSSPLYFGGFAYLLTPRCLVPRWRVVKSGWRVANNSSPLETPCLWAFQGIRWRVKNEEWRIQMYMYRKRSCCNMVTGAFLFFFYLNFSASCFITFSISMASNGTGPRLNSGMLKLFRQSS